MKTLTSSSILSCFYVCKRVFNRYAGRGQSKSYLILIISENLNMQGEKNLELFDNLLFLIPLAEAVVVRGPACASRV
jgi:hypothetical protein